MERDLLQQVFDGRPLPPLMCAADQFRHDQRRQDNHAQAKASSREGTERPAKKSTQTELSTTTPPTGFIQVNIQRDFAA